MLSCYIRVKYIQRGKHGNMKTKTGAPGSAITDHFYFVQASPIFKIFHYLASITCAFLKIRFYVSTKRVLV